jgi:hypothetical protein
MITIENFSSEMILGKQILFWMRKNGLTFLSVSRTVPGTESLGLSASKSQDHKKRSSYEDSS